MRNKFACVSDPNEFETCSGDRFYINYEPIVAPDGTIELVESEKDDIQAFIDSFREQTDISFILKRLAVGDTFGFRSDTPMYGDFTDMPKNYAEVLQLMIDKEAQFMKLPIEVRNSFDNDFKKWFATSGNEEWFDKMKTVLVDATDKTVGVGQSEDEVVKESEKE